MATYIVLGKYTHQGITNIREMGKRLEHNRETLRSLGADLKAFYLTMGQYDWVAVTDAPDDETAAKVALTISARGAVSTETLRAFSEQEAVRLVGQLP
jgi:uncharacterized protein with GYD domain